MSDITISVPDEWAGVVHPGVVEDAKLGSSSGLSVRPRPGSGACASTRGQTSLGNGFLVSSASSSACNP